MNEALIELAKRLLSMTAVILVLIAIFSGIRTFLPEQPEYSITQPVTSFSSFQLSPPASDDTEAVQEETSFATKEPATAITLESLAESGYALAQYWMGLHALDEDDIAGAQQWLTAAAWGGNSDAMVELGMLYQEDVLLAENDTNFHAALEWFEQAARFGNETAVEIIIQMSSPTSLISRNASLDIIPGYQDEYLDENGGGEAISLPFIGRYQDAQENMGFSDSGIY